MAIAVFLCPSYDGSGSERRAGGLAESPSGSATTTANDARPERQPGTGCPGDAEESGSKVSPHQHACGAWSLRALERACRHRAKTSQSARRGLEGCASISKALPDARSPTPCPRQGETRHLCRPRLQLLRGASGRIHDAHPGLHRTVLHDSCLQLGRQSEGELQRGQRHRDDSPTTDSCRRQY